MNTGARSRKEHAVTRTPDTTSPFCPPVVGHEVVIFGNRDHMHHLKPTLFVNLGDDTLRFGAHKEQAWDIILHLIDVEGYGNVIEYFSEKVSIRLLEMICQNLPILSM